MYLYLHTFIDCTQISYRSFVGRLMVKKIIVQMRFKKFVSLFELDSGKLSLLPFFKISFLICNVNSFQTSVICTICHDVCLAHYFLCQLRDSCRIVEKSSRFVRYHSMVCVSVCEYVIVENSVTQNKWEKF
jgi:hypothetical protein